MMGQLIKRIIKTAFPRVVIQKLRILLSWLSSRLQILKTRRIFERAPDTPTYLQSEMLGALQQRYPFLLDYEYDQKSLEDRGVDRAKKILRLPGATQATRFLELACWDGMVSCVLQRTGKDTTAIDNRSEGFDERAFREGVRLLQMNGAELKFEDESFDFVFSYDAFEHFAEPEHVLREAIRVVRKGGHIYLVFGPLYMSPFGQHAYRSITVPYCQFLFPKTVINHFANQKGLEPIDFNEVNGWSLEHFRGLWDRYSHVLKRVKYCETYDLSHLDLIRQYPSCFRSKTQLFENLIVSEIEVLFQKMG